jgi:hypothetical protein
MKDEGTAKTVIAVNTVNVVITRSHRELVAASANPYLSEAQIRVMPEQQRACRVSVKANV